MSKPITAIYFDLGKVLFDFDFGNMFAHMPHAMEKDPSRAITIGELAQHLETGSMASETFFRKLMELLPEIRSMEEARHAWCDVFRPIEENINIVRRLAEMQQHRLGVISNTNAPHMEQLRRLSDVFDCFDHLTLSHEVGCMKPNPAIYHAALQALGQPADQCLFFDDREENVRAARELGMHAVHVTEFGIVHDELVLRNIL